MIGIDHSRASVEFREKFAFTKSKVEKALETIKSKFLVSGVIIISTCNRSEIWLSDFNEKNIYSVIEEVYNININDYLEYFTVREGKEAVKHIFELSCGLKSKILGEDQILTQVRESLDLSRELGTTDRVLEKLFQISVTSAKKVKTTIRLTPMDTSFATKTLDLIKDKFENYNNLNCLVIGNGEVGRLTAKTLADEGINVTMTLRQYKRGAVVVPDKCSVIPYEDRLDYINNMDVIISGTLSPHCTLNYEDVVKVLDRRSRIFIDLAMPRDIDSNIKNIESCELYDIDSLSEHRENKELTHQIEVAKKILERYIEEFEDFYYYKDMKWMKLFREKKVGSRA